MYETFWKQWVNGFPVQPDSTFILQFNAKSHEIHYFVMQLLTPQLTLNCKFMLFYLLHLLILENYGPLFGFLIK